MKYAIMVSTVTEVNTDPQRRCYNGQHFSSELRQNPWEVLEYLDSREEYAERVKFWTDLNDYAVSRRGPSAKRQFRLDEVQPFGD